MTSGTSSSGGGYAAAGVDIAKAAQAVENIKKHVQTTHTPDVTKGVGAFAGIIKATKLKHVEDPHLLFTIDGVGTKTVVAGLANRWEHIGADIVHHCANDLVCQGGTPFAFLDYIASSSLDTKIVEKVIQGMSEACKNLDCILIGGEMAEMPQVYRDGEHDVVGSMIGYADKKDIFDTDTITDGDMLIALPSVGLHTNGYSLARKVLLQDAALDLLEHREDLGCSIADALLRPHACYSHLVRSLHTSIGLKGAAHITGGGICGNLSRILPKGVGADIQRENIRPLPIFTLIQTIGALDDASMEEAFNVGVGMILVADPTKTEAVLSEAKDSYIIGAITASHSDTVIR